MKFSDYLLNEENKELNDFVVNIDTNITSRQLIINALSDLDSTIKVDIKFSPSNIWINTKLSKDDIENLIGVQSVVISKIE